MFDFQVVQTDSGPNATLVVDPDASPSESPTVTEYSVLFFEASSLVDYVTFSHIFDRQQLRVYALREDTPPCMASYLFK